MALGLLNGHLPPGIHKATWDDLVDCFAFNPWRVRLAQGLRRGALALASAGSPTLWVDGSYVTDKPDPSDFDACWDHRGVDRTKVDPVLLLFGNNRALQKAKYRGEFFPNITEDTTGFLFREFFQIDKHTGNRKGIVELDLKAMKT
jgi:hypothetical protein